MKVVQTRISEIEYAMLKKMAIEKKSTIKETVKEAIETYIKKENVDPNDTLFAEPVAKKGAKDGSIKHNKYIYG